MTRPIVFRAVTWRGEGPGPWSFTAVPPAGFEQYRVTGSLRATTDSHLQDLELVTVNDPETGAQVAIRGDDATITLSGDADPKYVNRLWRRAPDAPGPTQGDRGHCRHIRGYILESKSPALPHRHRPNLARVIAHFLDTAPAMQPRGSRGDG